MNIVDWRNNLPRSGSNGDAHPLSAIERIIVHHDAEDRPEAYDDYARLSGEANYHISKGMGDGLQYHYSISNMGDIFWCRDLTDTLWHCGNYYWNWRSIAIKLDGNFQYQQPTQQQLVALQELLDMLCTQHPEFPADQNDVFGHREIVATACPGENLIDDVIRYRTTGKIVTVSAPVNPPVVQDPPTTKLFRVYDVSGKQVGAYTILANAEKKLDTLEAGIIKNSDGVIIKTKDKVEPPRPPEIYEGDPVTDTPETPVIPEPTPVVTPEARPTLFDWITGIYNIIVNFLKSYKK